jgi:hypothetical protein
VQGKINNENSNIFQIHCTNQLQTTWTASLKIFSSHQLKIWYINNEKKRRMQFQAVSFKPFGYQKSIAAVQFH